jgi:hypothetical protein
VQSVQRNLPGAAIRVYDDNSDDPATQAVLADLGVPVITPQASDGGRHGGLYANMQAALMAAETPWILFLQEDMQVVRPVGDADMATIATLFAQDARRAFVGPTFLKAIRLKRHQRLCVPREKPRCYRLRHGATEAEQAARIAYFDVAIGHVTRLRAAGWQFADTEHGNVQQARKLFSDMPTLGEPFVFYLPEVPVFRDRRKSLAARIAARLSGPGVKAFHDMTPEQVARFALRPLDQWPVAEDFLTPRDPDVRRPFVYKDVKRTWWLALLHRAESWGQRR